MIGAAIANCVLTTAVAAVVVGCAPATQPQADTASAYPSETLAPLFQGEGGDIATAYRILELPIVPPSHLRADVPPELDQIAMRALVRDRNGRFGSAKEMSDALDQVIRQTGVRREDLRQFIAACLAMVDGHDDEASP